MKSANAKETNFVIDVAKSKSGGANTSSSTGIQSDFSRFEICANSTNECLLYVNSLNFVTQLVKCKAYAFKGNDKGKN